MKKILFLVLPFYLLNVLPVKADEGMWTLYNLPNAVYEKMRLEGYQLPYSQLYQADDAIMKAVVNFSGYCSGVVVSPDGLVFTNHHCGFESIRSHSTVEHDYMLNGFVAKSYEEELPNEGMFVSFMVEQRDVTDQLMAQGLDTLTKERRAAQTAMYLILDSLTRMLTPILAYTADEIWRYLPHRADDDAENVLYNSMPSTVAIDVDDDFIAVWDRIHELRDTVKKSLEVVIKDKVVKSSLETCVTLKASGEEYDFIEKVLPELKSVFIVSEVKLEKADGELAVEVTKAEGEKCERCWAYSTTVGSDAEHPTLCARCAAILK